MPTNRTRRTRTNKGNTPDWALDLLAGREIDADIEEFNHWCLLARYEVAGLPLFDTPEGRQLAGLAVKRDA